jgi:UDP-GlcNAc:undecaprenyl-phosphate GlcNAc-1-phosphate transferase
MIPVLILALPIFDTSLVFISRLRRGKNPLTTAGKDHLSHRLARLSGSQREAVLLCYLVTGATGLSSIFLTQANLQEALVLGLGALVVALFALWKLEFRKD